MTDDEVNILKLGLRSQHDMLKLDIGKVTTARWSYEPTLTPAALGEYIVTTMEMKFAVTVGDDLVKFKRIA